MMAWEKMVARLWNHHGFACYDLNMHSLQLCMKTGESLAKQVFLMCPCVKYGTL